MMIRLTLFAIILPIAVLARGRYEFIDDVDLAAFYSMRSAQFAQQAQQQQQIQVQTPGHMSPVSQYSPFYHYPYYQPNVVTSESAMSQAGVPMVQPSAAAYNPYLHYGPTTAYRPAVQGGSSTSSFIASPSTAHQARAVPTNFVGPYSPYFTGQIVAAAKNKKKS